MLLRASSPPARRSPLRSAAVAAAALAGLLAAPAPAAVATPEPPTPKLTGLALGPDRLPDCRAVVAAMPPRARLAQRLMVGVDASDPATTAETVLLTQVGGIFIGGNATELLSDQALRGVQAMSRIPLAVAVDDEGGRVQRIDDLDGDLPSAREMATELSPLEVRELGRDRGRALAARGVTMNLAPTVDVSEQPAGAVIGDRSYGSDPGTVTSYAGAFAQGLREAGVFTVLKHFPGHGRGDGDSHEGRVTTPPLDELREVDLQPYADLLGPAGPLGNGRTGVLVGHLDVPGLTEDLPSSLTPAVYELLRGEYGFDGLVLTDDLGAMAAITDEFELPEAVERALAAGADIALWSDGGRVTPVLDALEQALAAGELNAEANDAAVARVLAAKRVCS
ncbi:glycoside hydrolase family 3 N-terminal domain-containing protein [Pseudonocardia nigra]|uniref:glycoside hydrolase family 3 N-terminal domain-containing protein n=1 Tax=Pseudonocardia nigra TaxID=1921578 RepID=UPI001C5F4645|nr:glycoside hydrolase family 3 N-terminal domain-containing protein [Pseudonocardia nigra]